MTVFFVTVLSGFVWQGEGGESIVESVVRSLCILARNAGVLRLSIA